MPSVLRLKARVRVSHSVNTDDATCTGCIFGLPDLQDGARGEPEYPDGSLPTDLAEFQSRCATSMILRQFSWLECKAIRQIVEI